MLVALVSEACSAARYNFLAGAQHKEDRGVFVLVFVNGVFNLFYLQNPSNVSAAGICPSRILSREESYGVDSANQRYRWHVRDKRYASTRLRTCGQYVK